MNELAESIESYTWASLTDAARRRVLDLIADLLGSALAGLDSPVAVAMRQVAARMSAEGPARVWGTGVGLAPLGAALANATLANAIDLEDGSRSIAGHPGSVVVPTALALADESTSGVRLLEAIAVGYETAIAVGRRRRPHPGDRWVHGWEVLAAAATAAKILDLPADGIARTLANAGFQGPNQPTGLATRSGSMLKSPCTGWACVSAITGAEMAQAGLSAPLDILDDERFYLPLPAGFSTGEHIEDTYFKVHASCRWTHAAIDAVLDVRSGWDEKPADVLEIKVDTFAAGLLLSRTDPSNPVEAQFTIPFAVAAALICGEYGAAQQGAAVLADPEIRALAERVVLDVDAGHDAGFPGTVGATVSVTTEQRRYVRTVPHPLGDPQNPLSPAVLERKFFEGAEGPLGRQRAERLLHAIHDLPHGDAALLLSLLGTDGDRTEKP
jgi:2-methylcitrate dehydratase PrpD